MNTHQGNHHAKAKPCNCDSKISFVLVSPKPIDSLLRIDDLFLFSHCRWPIDFKLVYHYLLVEFKLLVAELVPSYVGSVEEEPRKHENIESSHECRNNTNYILQHRILPSHPYDTKKHQALCLPDEQLVPIFHVWLTV